MEGNFPRDSRVSVSGGPPSAALAFSLLDAIDLKSLMESDTVKTLPPSLRACPWTSSRACVPALTFLLVAASAGPLAGSPLQQAYAKASNPGLGDNFGTAIALSGNTAVAGAPYEQGTGTGVNPAANDNGQEVGAAYVMVRNGTTWTQQAYVKASNPDSSDHFGYSVAIDGDTMVIGAPEESSDSTGVNGADNNLAASSGAAYVFVRSGTTWTQQAFLKPSNTGSQDRFGWSVSVSGDTIVVGSIFEDGSGAGSNPASDDLSNNSGAAYVFVRSGSTWSQQAYLKASNPGDDDWFGISVAVSGDSVIVGAPQENGSGQGIDPAVDDFANNAGAAYIFNRSGSTWTQQAYAKALNAGGFDRYGQAVAIDGDIAVVGAPEEYGSGTGVNPPDNNNAFAAGAVYVLKRNAGSWTQQAYLKASNAEGGDYFGYSVAVSGNLVAVGAYQEDGGGTGMDPAVDELQEFSGAAYVFGSAGGTWSQLSYVKPSNTEFLDQFGGSVAISGDTLAVGATGEDSDVPGINSVPHDSFFGSGSGAAYLSAGFTITVPAAPRIIAASKSGGNFIIDFTADPGLTGWQVKGSGDLAGFPDDRTALSTIVELSPGNYRATVSLAGAPATRYFLRIER